MVDPKHPNRRGMVFAAESKTTREWVTCNEFVARVIPLLRAEGVLNPEGFAQAMGHAHFADLPQTAEWAEVWAAAQRRVRENPGRYGFAPQHGPRSWLPRLITPPLGFVLRAWRVWPRQGRQFLVNHDRRPAALD